MILLTKNEKKWGNFENLSLQDFWGKLMTPKTQLFHPADQRLPQWSSISESKKNSFKKITTRFPDMYVGIVLSYFVRFSEFYFASQMRQEKKNWFQFES
jgi:hypothetical protein